MEPGAGFTLCVLSEEAGEVMKQTPQHYTHRAKTSKAEGKPGPEASMMVNA